jgi:hypothetical protein
MGGVELLAARSSTFIAVHHGAIFRHFLHLGSRRYSWCVVGVGVSIGVSPPTLSLRSYSAGVSDALLSSCWA